MEILVQTNPTTKLSQSTTNPSSSSSPPSSSPPKTVIMNNQEPSPNDHNQVQDQKKKTSKGYMILLVVNYLCLFVGSVSSSLLSKYYFIHKGSSRWVSTWVQCGGFPLLLLPIYLPYYVFKCTRRKPFSKFTIRVFLLSIFIGLGLGFNNLLFSWGNSYLPVSTSALLLSSQLVFNLIFSVLIVKQRVTFSNLNCVILLTLSSVLLGLASNNDKPDGLTKTKYFIGFFCTVGAGLLFALYLPIMESVYRKIYCYSMVVEMQFIMELSATALATVGMAVSGGYKEMKRESLMVFDQGPKMYWVVVIGNVMTWQLCFMGTAGMVFLTSSLTGGICMTAILAMNVVGGVVVYGDSFDGVKAVSTVLCGWGFCSYVYGMWVKQSKMKQIEEASPSSSSSSSSSSSVTMSQKCEMMVMNNNDHNRIHDPNQNVITSPNDRV